jgi:hypothetical protein
MQDPERSKELPATWDTWESGEQFSLQIQLSDDYGVHIFARDNELVRVALWCGPQDYDLEDLNRVSFTDWVEEAQDYDGTMRRYSGDPD